MLPSWVLRNSLALPAPGPAAGRGLPASLSALPCPGVGGLVLQHGQGRYNLCGYRSPSPTGLRQSSGLCKVVLELPCAWRVSSVAKCPSAPGDSFYAPLAFVECESTDQAELPLSPVF